MNYSRIMQAMQALFVARSKNAAISIKFAHSQGVATWATKLATIAP
jgi:hypothetical protein